MPALSNRHAVTLKRSKRPTSGKIIFISCEGQVTEEEYFEMISEMFHGVKSKIRFVSVMEEAVKTRKDDRTHEQISDLGKSSPKQLVEKIDRFRKREAATYEFDKHPEDEFWIIADVDDHTSPHNIEAWNNTLDECDRKNYKYAISNPFFEVWLLLHHTDVNHDDYRYAVTRTHQYERTAHFRKRLKNDAKAPLVRKKHIVHTDYSIEKVKKAIDRAKDLRGRKKERWPHNLGSTVYILIDKIVEIANGIY